MNYLKYYYYYLVIYQILWNLDSFYIGYLYPLVLSTVLDPNYKHCGITLRIRFQCTRINLLMMRRTWAKFSSVPLELFLHQLILCLMVYWQWLVLIACSKSRLETDGNDLASCMTNTYNIYEANLYNKAQLNHNQINNNIKYTYNTLITHRHESCLQLWQNFIIILLSGFNNIIFH